MQCAECNKEFTIYLVPGEFAIYTYECRVCGKQPICKRCAEHGCHPSQPEKAPATDYEWPSELEV